MLTACPQSNIIFSYDLAKTLLHNDMPTVLAVFKPGFKIYKSYLVINHIP